MKSISVPELHQAFQNVKKNDLFLDVRTPNEFSAGHIPGAKNIPVDQVMGHASELKAFDSIYVYCKMGGRAETACAILESLGLQNLFCLDQGGFPDWLAQGYIVD